MRRSRAFILVLAGLALIAGAVLWVGDALTQPARTRTGTPRSDLPIEPLTFASGSGATLSAWFIRGTPGAGAVLLLHAIRSSKVAMLGRAHFLHAAGFSVLLVDLQAHGESEGDRITFGYREASDVHASIDKLGELAPGERQGVIGVSLGGAALLLAHVQPRLSAVVLESVYPTIEAAVENRLRLHLGPIGPWLSPLLLAQLGPRLGIEPGVLRPIDRIASLRCPLLIVQGTEDRHTTLAEAKRLFDAAPQPKTFHAVDGAAHVDLHAFDREGYEQRVGTFLRQHLRSAR